MEKRKLTIVEVEEFVRENRYRVEEKILRRMENLISESFRFNF